MYRDEATAKPVHYYSKLPPDSPVEVAFVLDPMLATGGSALMAINAIKEWGVTEIKMLSIIASPEGIERIKKRNRKSKCTPASLISVSTTIISSCPD